MNAAAERAAVSGFRGEYGFLSNFWKSRFEFDGYLYDTVEHAYQASKACNDVDADRIRTCATPALAKRLARAIHLRPDWEEVKLDVMRRALDAKFSASRELCDKLLATGSALLVEANTWGDRFWGVCDGAGENHLGRLLMDLRAEKLEIALRAGTATGGGVGHRLTTESLQM